MILSTYESPIEEILGDTLLTRLGCKSVDDPYDQATLDKLADGQPAAFLFSQHLVGNYQADLLLVLMRPDKKLVRRYVLECDGAEFHETPVQIVADRKREAFIEAAGYVVFRFSGHEIYSQMDNIVERFIALFSVFGISPPETPPGGAGLVKLGQAVGIWAHDRVVWQRRQRQREEIEAFDREQEFAMKCPPQQGE